MTRNQPFLLGLLTQLLIYYWAASTLDARRELSVVALLLLPWTGIFICVSVWSKMLRKPRFIVQVARSWFIAIVVPLIVYAAAVWFEWSLRSIGYYRVFKWYFWSKETW